MCDTLEDAGYTIVGPASTLDEAHELVETTKFNAALLDANLSGEAVDEVAAALTRKGMPFAFVTGYGREALPEAFRHAPLLNKPLLPKSAFDMLEKDRKSVVEGKGVSVRVDLGGCRIIKKKRNNEDTSRYNNRLEKKCF